MSTRQPAVNCSCATYARVLIAHGTNGKAERFIQTLQREWAYGRIFQTSAERTAALEPWLNHYNFKRPHGAISHKPPGSRLTNVARNYT